MFKKLITGLVAGIIFTIFMAQRSEWVRIEFETSIRTIFKQSMQCDIACKVSRINFFSPTIELTDVRVEPCDACAWGAKKYLTGFSWFDLLIHKKLNLWVEVHDLDAHSAFNGTEIAILPHINALINEVAIDIPTTIKSVSIKHGNVHLIDFISHREIVINAHAEMHQIKNEQRVVVSFLSGHGMQRGVRYFDALGGSISCAVRDDALASVAADCHACVPHIDAQSPFYVVGSWQPEQGNWHMYNAEHKIDAQFALNKDLDITGEVAFQNLSYAQYPYGVTGKIAVHKNGTQWDGDIHALINDEAAFAGTWDYDHAHDVGACIVQNQTPLTLADLPYWRMNPGSITVHAKRAPGKFSCRYDGVAVHDLLATSNHLQGELVIADNKAVLSGAYNDEKYHAAIALEDRPYLIDAEYCNEEGAPQVACQGNDDAAMRCSLQFSFVRTLAKRLWNYDLQGQGTFELSLNRLGDVWSGVMHLADGAIRLPETYNFINGIDAAFSYDQATRHLQIDNLNCRMHTGRVQCANGRVQFDEQFKPQALYVPLLFEQCMLNFKRDLFALASGSVQLSRKRGEPPLLQGNLFIERAQLKENLLSQEFQKQLGAHSHNMLAYHAPDMNCDLTVETMHPIRIDTNVLKANAAVHLAITNNLADPQVSGTVRLIGGTIEFPYKPLMITEGTLHLLPGQLHNPLVELRAKNTIKNHTVALQVTGSLASHHVMFDASPPLSEEQIISLLLLGSHEESLATMAPALLVQNLKHALFGINEPTVFEKYMHKIAKPLNINLVPSFTDQTGRGGLRGALEIDVNDRWRAMIQKNFTLTEDTRFELDYLLSDDVTVRAIRDERRDVGGEVEMKWKF